MKTKIIEVTQNTVTGFNWGKMLLGRLDEEWGHHSVVGSPSSLVRQCGWTPGHLWVLDLQTGEGAFLRIGGSPHVDLEKHAVWVCPMYEPFLEWLYVQNLADLDALPSVVELPDAEPAFAGYRRLGPQGIQTGQEFKEAVIAMINGDLDAKIAIDEYGNRTGQGMSVMWRG